MMACPAPDKAVCAEEDCQDGRPTVHRVVGRFWLMLFCVACWFCVPDANLYAASCSATPQVGPEMVSLPGGSYRMGSPNDEAGRNDEEQQHEVTLETFAIPACEVTVVEFRRFATATNYQTTAETAGTSGTPTAAGCWHNSEPGKDDWELRPEFNWTNALFGQQDDDHPVVCVSHDDALAYVQWYSEQTGQSYRLPTEAEWEYATRAGSSQSRYFHDRSQCEYANAADQTALAEYPGFSVADCEDGYVHTAPVASFAPNDWGLYDTLGNAWEWTQDCWHINYSEAPANGRAWLEDNDGDCDRRVLRGGGWFNIPTRVRSAFRLFNNRDFADFLVGFRLARTPVSVKSEP